MKNLNHNGNTLLIVLAAVAVLGIAVLVGVQATSKPKTTTKSTTVIKTESEPSSIKSNSDLNQASKALDSTDIDGNTNTNSIPSDL